MALFAKGLPLALLMTLVACSGTAGTSPSTTHSESAPSASAASSLNDYADCATDPDSAFPHDAPALEALLPKTVAGRDLTIWSAAGWCWIEIAGGAEAAANFRPYASANSLEIDTMQYAIAGRSSVEHDPPYFVYVTKYPPDQATSDVAIYVFFLSGIGVLDPESFDASTLPKQVFDGKEVLVAPPELFSQDEHTRGGAYFYDTTDYLFAVATDDEAWAKDALSQLP